MDKASMPSSTHMQPMLQHRVLRPPPAARVPQLSAERHPARAGTARALVAADQAAQISDEHDVSHMLASEPMPRRMAARSTHHRQVPDRQLEQLASASLQGSAPVWSQQHAVPQSHQAHMAGAPGSPVDDLAQQGRFQEALQLLQKLASAQDYSALTKVSHRVFMRQAAHHKVAQPALLFLRTLPVSCHHKAAYQLALAACAAAKDTATAQQVVDLCLANKFKPDTKLLTGLMNVHKSVGAVDKAMSVYLDLKRQGLSVDAHVIGVLLGTFAEAMAADRVSSHSQSQDLRSRLVLMERATSLAQEAEEAGVHLTTACWNSLIVCAGRCGQLKRAFDMLEGLRGKGLRADSYTYGGLMEACIQAGRTDMAAKLFEQAHGEGHVSQVHLYTLAITAHRGPRAVDWQQVQGVVTLMSRHQVTPDAAYYSALIAAAGAAGQTEYAFEVLSDLSSEGLRPGPEVCSALIYACCLRRQQQLARRVYDLCAAKGVYPNVSQYNRLMDLYASERRLGDVVSLLTDMTQTARLQPNLNTYRVLLNACQRTDQAALAFDIFAIMKLNRIAIQQERFAATMYYTLIKCCLNMLRHIWAVHNPHPAPWASASRMGGAPPVRLAEARQVLVALGTSLEERGSSSLLLQDTSATTWAQYALSTYRDMLARGWKPNADILDKLLACLRIPCSLPLQHALATGRSVVPSTAPRTLAAGTSPVGTSTPAAASSATDSSASSHLQGAGHTPFSWASAPFTSGGASLNGDPVASAALTAGQRQAQAKYQLAFERRAVGVVEDAIARGLLPALTLDQPCTLDLTAMPANLAEAYVTTLLVAFERKAVRARSNAGAEGSAAGDAQLFYHRVTLLVPPFDPQYVLWPSYLPKLSVLQEDVAQRPNTTPRAPPSQRDIHSHSSAPAAAAANHNGHTLDAAQEDPHHQVLLPPGAAVPGVRPDTGLAVAATLRRFKFFARMEAQRGAITLDTQDIYKWVREKRTYELRLTGALNTAGAPQGVSVARQHIQIMAFDDQATASPSNAATPAHSSPSTATHHTAHAPPMTYESQNTGGSTTGSSSSATSHNDAAQAVDHHRIPTPRLYSPPSSTPPAHTTFRPWQPGNPALGRSHLVGSFTQPQQQWTVPGPGYSGTGNGVSSHSATQGMNDTGTNGARPAWVKPPVHVPEEAAAAQHAQPQTQQPQHVVTPGAGQ